MIKVVANGSNQKLGAGVATTYRPVGTTCPHDCPLLGNGCYAQRGRVNIQQRKASGDRHELRRAAGNILLRHLVSGDWFKPTKDDKRVVDRDLLREAIKLHVDCHWLTGWGYTHAAGRVDRAGFGPSAWPSNFRILASCETVEQKEQHNARGWQTARVIDELDERLSDEFACPVDAQKRAGIPAEKRTTCQRCRACFDDQTRNIVFLKF